MPSPFLTLAGWNDIFHEILNVLEPKDDGDYYGDDDDDDNDDDFAARLVFRSTLLSLALSCRALLDPSLDKLWNTLLSIHPVLNLLPNFQLHGSTYMEGLVLNSCSILDEDLLVVLANLRNLANLEASILLQDSSDAGQLDLKDGFPRLTHLELKLHCPPEYLTRFILATSMPRLRDLSLFLSSRHVDGVLTSFPAIWYHIGPHKLTRLRPLLPFAKLEELEFLFQEHLPLCDEDLGRFARAWPQLRALLFRQSDASLAHPNREPGALARPTLNGLVELARGCAKLVCVCIPDLDASASTLPKVEGVVLLRHGLLDLCIQNLVGAEDGERQLDVAVVLDRVFPGVKLGFKIRGPLRYDNNPNPHVEDSVNVSRLLRAMQIARTHYSGGI
ncbi:hypothetical protein V8D89_001136 [Ganoderma adspersum]